MIVANLFMMLSLQNEIKTVDRRLLLHVEMLPRDAMGYVNFLASGSFDVHRSFAVVFELC